MRIDDRFDRLRDALTAFQNRSVDRASHHAEAAVALVVRDRGELEVLLIRRAERAGDPWSGHIAFPGGRRASGDADLVGTALREAQEETGIDFREVGVLLGTLDEVEPGSRRLPSLVISPHVVAVPPTVEPEPDLAEVEHARWAPLSALREESAAAWIRIPTDGVVKRFPAIEFEDYTIWGLTYRILQQFLEVAEAAGF
jgi:8-oxo-dGTP pyrophosphatase MutT (NUDIX family)